MIDEQITITGENLRSTGCEQCVYGVCCQAYPAKCCYNNLYCCGDNGCCRRTVLTHLQINKQNFADKSNENLNILSQNKTNLNLVNQVF